MICILIAILSGALMSIQGVFNTELTNDTSIWVSVSFVQLSALITSLCVWFISDRNNSFKKLFHVQPRYILLGGIIGAFITYTVIKAVDKLGPAKAVMIIVISQLLTAYLIELFGMFGTEKVSFSIRKIIGLILAIIGIVIFKWNC
ncbi:MAG TPA: DMT family transporter [Clostridia bacterium]|jgi:transporter family-2 protein|nr:DMT family transporter [Clostridia bacterium]